MAPSIKQAPISCLGHSRPVVDIYFSAQTDCGSLFITAAKDGRAILRRGDTGDWIGTFIGHEGAVWSCTLDEHATKAATGAADFTAKLWDTTSGQQLLSITEDHIVRCIDLSKTDSGAYLLTATNSKKMTVYDLIAPTTPLLRLDAHDDIIRRALFCNGDRHALTASDDATVRLWDLKSNHDQPVMTVPLVSRLLAHSVTDFQFHHPTADQTGQVLLALTCGRTVQLHTFDWRKPDVFVTDEPTASFDLPCLMHSVSLHPTENLLVCGGEDHSVYRLDRSSGETLETCKGHFGPVHCVRFAPDGRAFASGSEDGTARLWQNEVGQSFGLWQLSVPATVVEPTGVESGDSNQLTGGDGCPPLTNTNRNLAGQLLIHTNRNAK